MVILIVFFILFILGISALFTITFARRNFLPEGEIMYADSSAKPAGILHSTTIPIMGRPDYVLKKDEFYIPVEVKTGKTPKTPYPNHVAQLYAYCFLVEERYHVRPPYGVIRDPEKEFMLAFPEQTENYLIHTVNEIIEKKKGELSRKELKRMCKECREHIKE